MAKYWLRGILLGASLALLLASGVALAQDGLFNSFNKDCLECWPGPGEPTLDRYLIEWTAGGWDPQYELCLRITVDGEVYSEPPCGDPPPVEEFVQDLWLPCEWGDNLVAPASALGREVSVAQNGPADPLGTWVWRFWMRNPQGVEIDSATASFLLAEICEEFVPEPGTLALLGSGLAGLAGYATLRWRTRK